MAEAATAEIIGILESESLTRQDLSRARALAYCAPAEMAALKRHAEQMAASFPGTRSAEKRPRMALQLGAMLWVLARYDEALAVLDEVKGSGVGAYLTARCLHALGRYDESAKAFAKAAHGDDFEIAMCVADARRQAGDLEGALQEVRKHQDSHADHAELHYQKGRCLDEMGEYEAATEAYEWACQIDPAHDRAAFRLAYLCDLRGLDDEAIAYYEKCAQARPTHVNALLNLGVLYEDKGALDRSMAGKALECYQRVLAADPRNARARLYARDAQGSLEMYYDEETRKRSDRAQSLLSTPVSDFELSVRSRNCLTKMDVRCLGDLARLTEEELLASKNFGETSLQEIKDMLHAKGLRLGMAIEEGEAVSDVLVVPSAEQQDALNRPIDELELSIRSRRAVDSLEVASLADLTRLTERQLLECPNFGQTSLNEIKRKLAERGLALRPEAE